MPRSWKDSLGQQQHTVFIAEQRPRRGLVQRLLNDFPPLTQAGRKLARLLVALTATAILFCALFPFDLSFDAGFRTIARRFDTSLAQLATAGDTFENILFFVPFGFALGGVLLRDASRTYPAGAIAVGASAALTLTVEVLQCFLGERDPSLADVLNNTLGGAVGFAVYRFVGSRTLNALAGGIAAAERATGATMMCVLTGAYVAAVCGIPLFVGGGGAGALAGWSPGYALCVGNELADDRTWSGTVSEIHFASRAASESEVREIFSGKPVTDVLHDVMVGSYQTVGEPPFVDSVGKLPPLQRSSAITSRPEDRSTTTQAATDRADAVLAQSVPTMPASQPVEVNADLWLRTAEPVAALTRAVTASGQLTAVVTATTARPDQWGQARILTVSAGRSVRNLTIAQDVADLVVRVRTGATGLNGTTPQFVVKDVFFDSRPRRIVVAIADGLLRVYVDSPAWRCATRLSPDVAAVWALYPRDSWSFRLAPGAGGFGGSLAGAVYRVLTFVGLGALAAATANQLRRPHRERVLIAAAIVAAGILLLEVTMTTVTGQRVPIGGMVAAALAGALGAAAVKIRHGGTWVSSYAGGVR
jgi:VanZ family protein